MVRTFRLRRPAKRAPETKVGYCRPPVHSRFKPGQSGNPKGRPKGSKTLQQIFLDEVGRPVQVKTAAGVQTMGKLQVLVRNTVDKALQGDLPCKRIVLGQVATAQAEKAHGRGGAGASSNEPPLSPAELAALKHLQRRPAGRRGK